MLELTSEGIGDGLESAVRMIGSADGLTRSVFHGSHLVDEQEGIHHLQRLAGEGTPDHESASFELAVRGGDADGFTGIHAAFDVLRSGLIRDESPLSPVYAVDANDGRADAH
jgi:hypothetical protein